MRPVSRDWRAIGAHAGIAARSDAREAGRGEQPRRPRPVFSVLLAHELDVEKALRLLASDASVFADDKVH